MSSFLLLLDIHQCFAIDRETQKKLREMQQEEKMQHLPSDERKEKTIRVSPEKMKRCV